MHAFKAFDLKVLAKTNENLSKISHRTEFG